MWFPEEKEANPETFLQNDRNNRIGVKLFKNGFAYTIPSGSTADALVILPDGTTFINDDDAQINQNGTNMTLNSACYDQLGPIQIAIRLKEQSQITTVGVIRGTVYPS